MVPGVMIICRGKKDLSNKMTIGQQNNSDYRHRFFNCVAWSRIVMHRTVYDGHVMFESVSAQLDSITFPRISEISKVRNK